MLIIKSFDSYLEEKDKYLISDDIRELLLKNIRMPKNIQNTYQIPPYPRHQVPNPGQWADVMIWMEAKALLDSRLPYKASVTTDYLP